MKARIMREPFFSQQNASSDTATNDETRWERLRRTHRISFRHWLKAFLYDVLTLLHEARIPLLGFLIVMASGTLYLRYAYAGGQEFTTLRAALYETMTMLALEQDARFPADLLGQFLFFAIPILGLAFVFQGVLDFGRLLLDKSSRLEDWQVSLASTYQEHIIVCGLGRVSYRLVMQLLEAGYEVVVIESDWNSEFVQDTLALNVPIIHGDARSASALRQAGIFRARGMVSAISNDLANIEVALSARRIRKDLHVVLRIFNEHLDYNLERSKFGRNTAFSSSALAAPTLAAAAICRGIKFALPLPEARLGISELTVSAGSHLDSLVHRIEQRFQVQVIGYMCDHAGSTAHWRHRIHPSTRLYAGDRLLLLGTLQNLGEVWKYAHCSNQIMQTLGMGIGQQPTLEYGTVIICGLGKVGYRVVKALCQMQPGLDIVVICRADTTRARFISDLQKLGVRVFYGDARAEETLREAGIERAFSVAAVTSDALSNLRIGLTARQIRSDIHLVLRVFSDVLADQLETILGFQTTFSTSVLAAPTLSAAVVVKDTGYAVDIGDRLFSTVRLTVQPGDEFAGQQPARLREESGMVVVSIRRQRQLVLLPRIADNSFYSPDSTLQAGDEIVVLADIHIITHLRMNGAESAVDSNTLGAVRDSIPHQDMLRKLLLDGVSPEQKPQTV
jgi:Trk K+ transport system NAD-binding subunit